MPTYSRRTWLASMLGAFTSVSLASCRDAGEDRPDVCVVGSGPAGAVLASELVGQGMRTVLLEGGLVPSRRSTTFSDDTFPVTERAPIPYPVESTRFMGEGGTSNLWTGRCPRFQPADFSPANPYSPAGNPWPVAYSDLEPYYARAEKALSIGGGASTRYSPPRTSEFPLPPVPASVAACLLPLTAERGLTLEVCPQTHAPRVATTHLPIVKGAATGRMVIDAKVVAIDVNDHGEVTGLQARSPDGTTQTIRARAYVLATGGIETPRLLLLSRPASHPDGVGNAFDQVGRYFCEHLGAAIGTYAVDFQSTCTPEDIEQAVSWQFYEPLKRAGLGAAILEFSLDSLRKELTVTSVFEMRPSAANRVILSPRDTDAYGLSVADVIVALGADEQRTFDRVQALGPEVAKQLGARPLTLNRDRVGWCHHHMCTCRMGDDPRTSVVDANLRVHGLSNLYVAGSSVFVTIGAGSPTLLLTALTLRLADHLVRNRAA